MLLSLTTGTWPSIFQKIRREQITRSRSLFYLHSTSKGWTSELSNILSYRTFNLLCTCIPEMWMFVVGYFLVCPWEAGTAFRSC
jgi:hypothetical protein